jgi:tripartite-type tricarboxylate transporter receptor subunit TctC
MKLLRRKFIHLAAGAAAALPAASRMAWGRTYPTRPVRIIVGLSPGGTADIVARLMSEWLSKRLGQQFIVDNRPGASGNIAAEAVVHSPADGYTLLLINGNYATGATLFTHLGFNFIRDIAPVGSIDREAIVIGANLAFPPKTLPELVAYAKAHPGKVNFASPGTGTVQHVSAEMFKMMTGVDMVHVPYRGGALALTDVFAGRVQTIFAALPLSIQYIRSGKLRALAVTTAQRSKVLPNTPAVGEFVPGYEASTWYGIGAPKGTPAEVIGIVNAEINAALVDPGMKARIADLGGASLAGSPADFAKLIVDDTEKWRKVIREANIKVD